jgi:hypothetical protein
MVKNPLIDEYYLILEGLLKSDILCDYVTLWLRNLAKTVINIDMGLIDIR